MKRSNVPAKIPPAPPNSKQTHYKPVQIGKLIPPSKPLRCRPKSAQTDDKNLGTLSNVTVAFNSDQKTLPFSTDNVYENLKVQNEQSCDSISDNLNNCVLSEKVLDEEHLNGLSDDPLDIDDTIWFSDSFGQSSSNIPAESCGTFDNFLINPIGNASAVYENYPITPAKRETYPIANLGSVNTKPISDQREVQSSSPLSLGSILAADSRPTENLTSFRERIKSLPSKSPLPSPTDTRHPINLIKKDSIYKDPCSVSKVGDRLKTSHSEETNSDPPTDTRNPINLIKKDIIYKDPCSLFKVGDRLQTSHSEETNSDPRNRRAMSAVGLNNEPYGGNLDNFVAMRRKEVLSKPRAISEIILAGNRDRPRLKDLFKKSVPERDYEYVDRNDIKFHDSPAVNAREDISSRIKRSLPESVVSPLTPTVFDIPQPNPSIFYTDQGEHIYSSSLTLGSLSFPDISVSNVGYRDPVVRAVQRNEESISIQTTSEVSASEQSPLHSDDPEYAVPRPITVSRQDWRNKMRMN